MLKKLLALACALLATVAMAAVDVNKATDAELDSVKGIGPATSKLIMSERKKGEFKSWEDLIERVKGIGGDRAAKLSAEGLTVNGDAFKGAASKKDAKAAAKADKKDAKVSADKPAAAADTNKSVATAAKPADSAKK